MGSYIKNENNKILSRGWVVTIHEHCMLNVGLTEEDCKNAEKIADKFIGLWEDGTKGRRACITVSRATDCGLFHAHLWCYGNTTTLKKVAELFGNAHVEPQKGGAKKIKDYFLKQGEFAVSHEEVIYSKNLEYLQDAQDKRNDLDQIGDLIAQGLSPQEVMAVNFRYRRYEKLIKKAYLDKRFAEMPPVKEMYTEWHFGASGSGKTHFYTTLCEEYSPENIYFTNDSAVGCFDKYVEQNAPDIVFIDEFKGYMSYGTLLSVLDKYPKAQIHCRFYNAYALWTKCYITSIYSPDVIYKSMVTPIRRTVDTFEQLIRRIDYVVYHHKTPDGKYYSVKVRGCDYISEDDMQKRMLKEVKKANEQLTFEEMR